jgi:RHS repeat-associated protein
VEVRAKLQVNYTAYGLKIAGISSRAFTPPSPLERAGVREQYQGEFADFEEELDWNDFALRSYDPQLGRWLQQDPYDEFSSPYVGMGNDAVNLVDPSGGNILSSINSLSVVDKLFLGAVGGGLIGAGVNALTGNDIGKGFIKGMGIGIAAVFLSSGFAEFGGSFAINAGLNITSTITSIHANEVEVDLFHKQFKKNEVTYSNSELYRFRKKHFKKYPGPVKKMTTEVPKHKDYILDGDYFYNTKTKKRVLGLTVTTTHRIGNKRFTQSSIHFAKAAFYSPETLFNVMGHEMAHLQINIDAAANNENPPNDSEQHLHISLWHRNLALNMGWKFIFDVYNQEYNSLSLMPEAHEADFDVSKSLEFLPLFFKK